MPEKRLDTVSEQNGNGKTKMAVHEIEISELKKDVERLEETYKEWIDKYYTRHSELEKDVQQLKERLSNLVTEMTKEQEEKNNRLRNTFALFSIIMVAINIAFAVLDHIFSP